MAANGWSRTSANVIRVCCRSASSCNTNASQHRRPLDKQVSVASERYNCTDICFMQTVLSAVQNSSIRGGIRGLSAKLFKTMFSLVLYCFFRGTSYYFNGCIPRGRGVSMNYAWNVYGSRMFMHGVCMDYT